MCMAKTASNEPSGNGSAETFATLPRTLQLRRPEARAVALLHHARRQVGQGQVEFVRQYVRGGGPEPSRPAAHIEDAAAGPELDLRRDPLKPGRRRCRIVLVQPCSGRKFFTVAVLLFQRGAVVDPRRSHGRSLNALLGRASFGASLRSEPSARRSGGATRMSRVLNLIGAPSSAGAYAPGQEKAPAAFRRHGLIEDLTAAGVNVADRGDVPGFRWRPDPLRPKAMNLDAVRATALAVAPRVTEALGAGGNVMVL